MQKYFLLFLLVILFACSNKNNVRLTGKIENLNFSSKIYLYEQKVSESKLVDSSSLSKNGEFKFKFKITEPRFYFLRIPPAGMINVLLSPGEDVKLSADALHLNSSLAVDGSVGTLQVLKINQRHNSVLVHLDSLRAQYRRISDPPKAKEQVTLLENDFRNTKLEERKNTIRFIIENFKSMASIMALYLKYDSVNYVLLFPQDLQYYKIVSDSLTKEYPASRQVKALKVDFDNMMKVHKSELMRNLIKNTETAIPEISLPNINGDTLSLTRYVGKVIILNFWSFASKACLMVNRDFMNLYKKYSKSGLVIYQVSLDIDKSKWKEAAKDLPWLSVAEISTAKSYYGGVYNISEVPTSFLIDQKGNILGKNFTASELDKKISALLKK